MWNEKKFSPHFRVTPLIFWGLVPKERGNIETWNFGIGVLQQFGTLWHVAKIVFKNHCTLLCSMQALAFWFYGGVESLFKYTVYLRIKLHGYYGVIYICAINVAEFLLEGLEQTSV